MARKRKLVILSVSAGVGHLRAAQALEAWATLEKSSWEVIHLDLMTMVPSLFRKIYSDLYVAMVRSLPEMWGHLYAMSDKDKTNRVTRALRRELQRLGTLQFMRYLEAMQADRIICTHFLPAELISDALRKKKLNIPVWVVVTDYDVHRLWVYPHLTGYFAASDEVAYRMEKRGIPGETVRVTGIPIAPAFAQQYLRAECAAELGLNPKLPIILFMSGGIGIGGMEKTIDEVAQAHQEVQIVALAGRNEQLRQNLEALARKFPERLVALPFTSTIERLMGCADFAVTKPGGLTTAECLAMGLPMVVISPIPGQEERNADFLLEQGAAVKALDGAGVIYKIQQLLQEKDKLEALRVNAKRLGKPHAARDILNIVLMD